MDAHLTKLLHSVGQGDRAARDSLWRLIYDELHAMARQQMARECPGRTLQATALVHEVYLRLLGDDGVQWSDRVQFFSAAARAMQRIRIDDARRRNRRKRAGDREREPFDDDTPVFDDDPGEVLAVNELLEQLEALDERKARVVRYRYFLGLTVEETAGLLQVSPRTVNLDWRMARAWLHRAMREPGAEAAGDPP